MVDDSRVENVERVAVRDTLIQKVPINEDQGRREAPPSILCMVWTCICVCVWACACGRMSLYRTARNPGVL